MNNDSVKSIYLHNTNITNISGYHLLNLLDNNNKIKKINIDNTKINDEMKARLRIKLN